MESGCECVERAIANGRQDGGPPACGLGEGLTTPHRRIKLVTGL
jgi:hypothetical protein